MVQGILNIWRYSCVRRRSADWLEIHRRYYEDVALILRETILRAVAPDRLITPIIDITELPEDEAPAEEEGSRAGSAPKIHKQEHLELRCGLTKKEWGAFILSRK